MKTKFYLLAILLVAFTALTSFVISTQSPLFSSVPPIDHTGVTGNYCTNCHGGVLNSGGGTVSAPGLPAGSYSAGAAYNFSLITTHGAANRTRWGFSISAVNSVGDPVGTFSTTNPNVALNGTELSHNNAVSTTSSASFTYNNLTWTAPATPGPNDANVSFYFVSNAANGAGTAGDFIYAGTITNVVLPVTISSFTASVFNKTSALLAWRTETEQNTDYFSIQRSENGIIFTEIGRESAAGNSNAGVNYNFTDQFVPVSMAKLYYRIETNDLDGRKKLSSVQIVEFDKAGLVCSVFPNPTATGQKVNFVFKSEIAQPATLSLFSIDGKLLRSVKINALKGKNVYSMNVPQTWSKGNVLAKFSAGDKIEKVQMVIQ